jgi:2-octaprenyl-6-methoxyphenol hydroxylase
MICSRTIKMQHYDIIIVGGGLVGAGLAAALQASNLQVALIDARLPSSDDPRLFALNAGSCQFLKNLSLWDKLEKHACPIHQVHVSHQGHFGCVRLNHEDVNLAELGCVIPAYVIETALNQALLSLPNCTIYRPAKLQSLQQENNCAQLKIMTEEEEIILTSSLVIGADGTESTVRKQLNIHAQIFDYEQSALVTRTLLKRPHRHIAYERFTTDGAIAMLPLSGDENSDENTNDECATIWTAKTALISELMALPEAEFLNKLQQEFGYRLGKLQAIKKRHVFPLRMLRAEKAVEQCVFLLGNSAHTLHPIAAQGFNLAIYEVAALAESIIEKAANHQTFTAEDLEKISAKTQKQQASSIGMSHRLAQLFSKPSAMMGCVLQLGMLGLDIANPVKKKLIQGILGRTGQVPRLLLDE